MPSGGRTTRIGLARRLYPRWTPTNCCAPMNAPRTGTSALASSGAPTKKLRDGLRRRRGLRGCSRWQMQRRPQSARAPHRCFPAPTTWAGGHRPPGLGARALVGCTAYNGWGPSAVSARAARPLLQLISRGNSSSGSNGASQGLTASAPTPRSCAQLSAAFTPANGPAASPGASRSTGNPCAWASAAVCVPGRALTATVRQLRCNRLLAHSSSGVPASNATAFSPPKRTDRPPAITTPTTGHAKGSCWVIELMALRRGTPSVNCRS